ncbi:hypothetical protein PI124_g21062 [Phytophthora idaei]|nr:hypothetical protein PI125_g20794 [Phytophthora idaei]KAG3129880.1 hypothetical protein PI126_g20751 [Phytophthora idaei]KAG3233873.1 hypothetical protein PI124_g21062 [Phytophthora idaei]
MDLEMKPIADKTSEDSARRTFEDITMVDTEDQGDTGMASTTNTCVRSEARDPKSSKAGRQNAVGQSRLNSRDKQLATKVGLPDVAIKQTRLADVVQQGERILEVTSKQANDDSVQISKDPLEPHGVQRVIVPDAHDEIDSVVVEKRLTDQADGVQHLPIQIGRWLAGYQGEAVTVEAKGQCAFLALYASTTNHHSPQLKNNVSIVTGATELKMSIYALMMVNFRGDVELELIDPIQECAKHY